MAYKTYLNWSSGKDAAFALHYLQQDKNYEVAHLLTAINAHHNRVSMHGVRRELLEQQIAAIGLPFSTIELPEQPSMQEYEAQMERSIVQLKSTGFTHAAFGDIFLEDLRLYREQQLQKTGVCSVFPLWKKDTKQMLQELIGAGFKAIVVCINAQLLPEAFAGRIIDETFINDLPANIDACGENGEFHTFCFDGPIFKKPVPFTVGEKVFREYKAPASTNENDECFITPQQTNMGFWFCDLLPTM
jgi:uncharacterized protein (TIGR00290 family)